MRPEKLYHIGFYPGDIDTRYAILPGDPGRVKAIAALLDEAYPLASNREYDSYVGKLEGRSVVVCSTGIGGPSAAIALEELSTAGVETVIRVGTCGAMQLSVCGGDLVVAVSAVRQEGTSHEYAPVGYPATADFTVTEALKEAAGGQEISVHTGVVHSKDSFYGQHDPGRMPVSGELISKWNAYKALGVLASEMECAAIFTVAASLKMRAGAVLQVIWNQERAAAGMPNPHMPDTGAAIACAVGAVRRLIRAEKSG
ncbi:MAG TPA: uridine phosphorylase [Ruminococcaceae bacterium]|nr:uridine phosphorylase [Oscillospiraceae bacterium]